MSEIEYFYSAHSAFAYLGSARFMEIAAAAGRKIVHKPVILDDVVEAVTPVTFVARSKKHRAYYFGREIERWAEFRNIPLKLGMPSNHRNDTTLVNSMVIAAILQGHNVDQLAHSLLMAHWADHTDLADKANLTRLAGEAGLDGDALLEAATSDEIKAVYAANTAEAIERSVFGSPTYVVDGDMFYGQDRLELLERALQKPFAKNWP
ncbi:MAG: 2-hydroxychromene-2-carboxylate isomerase [Rhizobiales bacterium]|nr:2-hydroxychromene-2-carboxylate isomerase [Hyphomicrobiales bacterium]